MLMVAKLRRLSAGVCAAVTLSGCTLQGQIEPFDESQMTLLQLTELREGEDIAVISTEKGEIRLRFFPSEAPVAVENFIALAQSGAFDGQPLRRHAPKEDMNPMLTASSQEGPDKKEKYKGEISSNLCSFSGAVLVKGSMSESGGGFSILGTHSLDGEELEALLQEGYPEEIVEQFSLLGGEPYHWLRDTVFAQVYSGQEVVDAILADSQSSIAILSVTIESYAQDA